MDVSDTVQSCDLDQLEDLKERLKDGSVPIFSDEDGNYVGFDNAMALCDLKTSLVCDIDGHMGKVCGNDGELGLGGYDFRASTNCDDYENEPDLREMFPALTGDLFDEAPEKYGTAYDLTGVDQKDAICIMHGVVWKYYEDNPDLPITALRKGNDEGCIDDKEKLLGQLVKESDEPCSDPNLGNRFRKMLNPADTDAKFGYGEVSAHAFEWCGLISILTNESKEYTCEFNADKCAKA